MKGPAKLGCLAVWSGLLVACGTLSLYGGQPVQVTAPRQKAANTTTAEAPDSNDGDSVSSFFSFSRPSRFGLLIPGNSLGGAIDAPIQMPPQEGFQLDPRAQKKLLDEVDKRRNWLREGSDTANEGRSQTPEEALGVDASDSLLTRSQRQKSGLNLKNPNQRGARDGKNLQVGDSKLGDNSSEDASIESDRDRFGENLSSDRPLRPNDAKGFEGLSSALPGNRALEKSMFEFSGNGNRSDRENGFFPGLPNQANPLATTSFGNPFQSGSDSEPKSPLSSTFSPSSGLASPTFGGPAAIDAGSSPFQTSFEPAQSIFSAPPPLIPRPIPAAPAFVPRPMVLPGPQTQF
jgi:hypothetical protein